MQNLDILGWILSIRIIPSHCTSTTTSSIYLVLNSSINLSSASPSEISSQTILYQQKRSQQWVQEMLIKGRRAWSWNTARCWAVSTQSSFTWVAMHGHASWLRPRNDQGDEHGSVTQASHGTVLAVFVSLMEDECEFRHRQDMHSKQWSRVV